MRSTKQPKVLMPAGLAEKVLWSLPFDSPSPSPSSFVFHDDILSEARALTSYAFSHVVQMASLDAWNAKSHSPIISLYYPHHGCHEIIDSMVKSLAHDQRADVVVLDSLELALQEFGAFGKEFAQATDVLYNVQDDPNKGITQTLDTRDDHTIQSVFNYIVDIRQRPDPHENSNAVEQPSPRIVYMRDFGSIASSASLLIPYLLQALSTRRSARFQNGSLGFGGPLQPTVLIFGFSETPNSRPEIENDPFASYYPLTGRRRPDTARVSKDFSHGGTARQILPQLDNKLFTLENETFPASLFSSSFFLPSLTDAKELCVKRPTIKTPPITHSISRAAAIFIFPVDSQTKGFRNVEQRMASNRSQAIRNGWMTLCLGRRGAVVSGKPLDSILADHTQKDEQGSLAPIESLDELHKRTGLLSPVSLDHIASIAVGLASLDSSATTAAIQVTSALVSRASRLFVQNLQTRSEWTKMAMGHEDDKKEGSSDSDSDEKQKDREESESETETDGMQQKKVKSADSIIQKVKKATDLNCYEKRLLTCIVDAEKLETRFEDVCIPGNTINSLRTVVSLPLLHPSAFKVGVLGREGMGGVLLYGPPGTGKTLLCRALARECGVRMLQLRPSDIMDCWVGESEKLAKAIFSLAYRLAPCVIFIDEMDSLFKARVGKEDRQYQRNILNEFLQSMDGLQSAGENKNRGVVVVGATNRPFDLDDAIVRRFATRLMVTLPNEGEREQILRLHLRDEQLGADVDLHGIASKTDHYSGSDLKALCVSAAMASVKDSVGNFSWTLHADTHDQPMSDEAHTRTITMKNFEHAFDEVLPSSTAGGHSQLQRWHAQFNRKKTSDIFSGLGTPTYAENDYSWKK